MGLVSPFTIREAHNNPNVKYRPDGSPFKELGPFDTLEDARAACALRRSPGSAICWYPHDANGVRVRFDDDRPVEGPTGKAVALGHIADCRSVLDQAGQSGATA